jgi:nitronate monooxygenase
MAAASDLVRRLRAPIVAAPLFLVSGPDLVVETCRSGLIGTFPALNRRDTGSYCAWLADIGERLDGVPGTAPFGVNLVVHRSNGRLDADLAATVVHKVPLVITSLGASAEVVAAVHGYGGIVLHDVTGVRHAEKALAAGVDGLIAVCAGAGGHAGTLSPFALLPELRRLTDGLLVLGGALSTGRHVAAARLLGADLAYLGTRFVATQESLAAPAYREMIRRAAAADVVYTAAVSGVPANFLRASLLAAGIDPDRPRPGQDFGTDESKAWRDVWSAGQGVGSIDDTPPAALLCKRLIAEYEAALRDAAAWAA